ncbi:HAMP domain-containing histidine kinase [candidate division KSB1 bacterium]|nr:HAMP domain-containing histidine kinase [candidate division KSB1 bacterium]
MHEITQDTNGSMTLNKEEFDLRQLLQEIFSEYSLTFEQRKQKANLSTDSSPMHFFGDRHKIKQMIGELIQNAIKYIPDGGEITVSSTSDSQYQFIDIIDSGIGIPNEEQGKIFEKFYEVQNSDYHSSSSSDFMGCGMGLGLTFAKAIAEAHEGGIRVVSQVNEGSQFRVYLPVILKDNQK